MPSRIPEDETLAQLASNIDKAIYQKRIGQNELAERIGASGSMISLIRRGLRFPSLPTLVALRKELDVSWQTLMKGV